MAMKNHWIKQDKLEKMARQLLLHFKGIHFTNSDTMQEHYEKIKSKVFSQFKDMGQVQFKVKFEMKNGEVTNITITERS